MSYHYAFDAARLLEDCLEAIQEVIGWSEHYASSPKATGSSFSSLYDMKEALIETERQLFYYVAFVVQTHVDKPETLPEIREVYDEENPVFDLHSGLAFLDFLLKEQQQHSSRGRPATTTTTTGGMTDAAHDYYPRRSAYDSLLFRLKVALQLCLVRIDDARLVLCGHRKQDGRERRLVVALGRKIVGLTMWPLMAATGLVGISSWMSKHNGRCGGGGAFLVVRQSPCPPPWMVPLAQSSFALFSLRFLHTSWSHLWMNNKLVKSTDDIEEWCRQWTVIIQCPKPPRRKQGLPQQTNDDTTTQQPQPRAAALLRSGCGGGSGVSSSGSGSAKDTSVVELDDMALDAARSRRLIEYALHDTPKSSFWLSQGELRFLMLKKAMDVFYASVGTAMDLTKAHHVAEEDDQGGNKSSSSSHEDGANWQLTLVTAAAASFYSLTGARDKAAAVTSSSATARDLIHNAWGMVSLPAVKNLSLQASRLLKGAAVADRIEICGVHCFVLSSDPAPELAAAIKRNHRMHQRRKPIKTLSTIDEQEEHVPEDTKLSRRHRRSLTFSRTSRARYRQRDVVLHLTGGGFMAHIIASDLPYLVDWSCATGAVVICPEYALLPEHTFPVALNQIEEVYQALVSQEAVSALGFETNRVIVTGESAGGNLAASLCVKLCLALQPEDTAEVDGIRVVVPESSSSESSLPCTRLPDALMLSCPVLNLSLELSYSRVVGTEDPVLPSGLLSAICDAYLPKEEQLGGISKKDPLVSPFYASDAILRQFPPTLLFASSNDPLLDDSVVFNQRLRTVGVECNLLAGHNLPHAYWGLGTAGFPEALKLQEQCVDWLTFQLTRDENA